VVACIVVRLRDAGPTLSILRDGSGSPIRQCQYTRRVKHVLTLSGGLVGRWQVSGGPYLKIFWGDGQSHDCHGFLVRRAGSSPIEGSGCGREYLSVFFWPSFLTLHDSYAERIVNVMAVYPVQSRLSSMSITAAVLVSGALL
jgi:hypothetical protein